MANQAIKPILEKVMNTYNDSLKKVFNHPNWQPQSPLLLSKVDKKTAQELLPLIESLPEQDKEVGWGGFHFPFGIYVISKTVQEGEVKDLMTIKDWWCEKSEKYLDTLSQVIQELKEIVGERERERDENWGCEICGKSSINSNKYVDTLHVSHFLKERGDSVFKFKTNSGKEIWKKAGEKIITCKNCYPNTTSWDVMVIDDGFKYRYKGSWPPNWLNNCVLCENQYKEAKEKVRTEPNRYELKERKECSCCHLFNRTLCSSFECFVNHREKCYINENGKEVNEKGQEHHEVCMGATSRGNSRILIQTYFYKTKPGQICDICQKTINSLESWEIKAKEQIKERCSQETHYKKHSYTTPSGGGGDWGKIYGGKCSRCGKGNVENSFGDIEPCEKHGKKKNNSLNSNQSIFLPNLKKVKSFFIANNINIIIIQNNNIVINFNQNTTNNTVPSPQIITEQQINNSNSDLGQEQRTMWQRFKDYLKSIGRTQINRQQLEQEIQRLETTQETNKEKPVWPWIIGGISLIVAIGFILILARPKKRKKKRLY